MRVCNALLAFPLVIGLVGVLGKRSGKSLHLSEAPAAEDEVLLARKSEPQKQSMPNETTFQTNLTIDSSLLLAPSVIGDSAPPSCSVSPLRVSFMLSQCLTDDEIVQSLALFETELVTGSIFYTNDQKIATSYSWTTYWDSEGDCGVMRGDPSGIIIDIERDSNPVSSEIWVDVNTYGTKKTSMDILEKSPAHFMDFLLCPDLKCDRSSAFTVIPAVTILTNYIVDVTSAMYCSAKSGSIPVSFTDDYDMKQCSCCVVGEQCVCPAPRVVSKSGGCVCPHGTVLVSGECVDSCFQTNAEANCKWTDFVKTTALSLDEDCGVTLPIAQDNYVADNRVNENDATQEKPMLSLTATNQIDNTESVATATWKKYTTNHRVLEKQITLDKFGVYDLSMSASDYRHEKTCYGCLAVNDFVRPQAKEKCPTSLKVPISAEYSEETLNAVISNEAAFTAFYDKDNIINNGDFDPETGANERCDYKTYKTTDFFASYYSSLDSIDTVCFDRDFVSTLVAALPDVNDLNGKSDSELSELSCDRCCDKFIMLREYYYNYQCGVSPSKAPKGVAISEACSFAACLAMPATTLASAEVIISEGAHEETLQVLRELPLADPDRQNGNNNIHRTSSCTLFHPNDPDCAYAFHLKDMFARKSQWKQPGLSTIIASEHVFWRYTLGGSDDWKSWDDEDEIVINAEFGSITVEAWTHCGLLTRATFDIYVHLTSAPSSFDFCPSFAGMWKDISSNPRIDDDSNAICAYENSDFALMRFSFDSTKYVQHEHDDSASGYFSDVKCFVTVAKRGDTASVAKVQFFGESEREDSNEEPIDINVEAAFELVHDPMTAVETDVKVRCEFTYTYYDDRPNEVVKCGTLITVTDCDKPNIELSDVCGEGVCQDPTGLPGLYESCGGTVYTTDGKDTMIKPVFDECCGECDAIQCRGVGESKEGIKRCEIQTMDLVMLSSSTEDHAWVNLFSAVALGATALVVVVVLVAKRDSASATIKDDVYYPLRD